MLSSCFSSTQGCTPLWWLTIVKPSLPWVVYDFRKWHLSRIETLLLLIREYPRDPRVLQPRDAHLGSRGQARWGVETIMCFSDKATFTSTWNWQSRTKSSSISLFDRNTIHFVTSVSFSWSYTVTHPVLNFASSLFIKDQESHDYIQVINLMRFSKTFHLKIMISSFLKWVWFKTLRERWSQMRW